MSTKQIPMTKAGLERIRKELEELVNVRRPELARRIHDEKELVGAQNTPEYEDVRAEQAFVEGRINELQDMLDNVVIIEETHDHQQVSLGSTVKVKTHDGKTVTYTVVGIAEADPKEGKISNESPVGEALLGKKVGETFDFNAPAGTLTWKIISVD